jgi:hypothetical protein
MLRESNWPLEPPFFKVKVFRKLTGILEVPGIFSVHNALQELMEKRGFQTSNGVREVGSDIRIRIRLFGPRIHVTCFSSTWSP